MVAAALLLLAACSGRGQLSAEDAEPPVVLVEGTPQSATVQGPDGTQHVVGGAPLQALLAPAFPLAAFKSIDDAGDRYGLDQPSYIAEFSGRDGGRTVIVLGSQTFDGEGFYARRCGDDRIHLVTRTLHAALEQIARDGRPETVRPLGC